MNKLSCYLRPLFFLLILVFFFAVPQSFAQSCVDNDTDGYGSPGDASCPNGAANDCDDTDDTVFPGAQKLCDGKDNNCDGRRDFSTDVDNDSDGYAQCGECNDNNPNINPGAQEGPVGDGTCSDSLDNDCDFLTDSADQGCQDPCLDNDSDGYGSNGDPSCPSGSEIDCNDNNASINPGAADASCNNVDENCSGVADDGYVETPTGCGTGVCTAAGQLECQNGIEVDTCTPGLPQQPNEVIGSTCNDTLDNDCDGAADAADGDCFDDCLDNDSDGYGANGHPNCSSGTAIDCDDNDATINPGATDSNCNNVDEDCSGVADDAYVVTPTNCGLGECVSAGQLECQSGVEVDTCVAGTAGIEGPVDAPNCSDGLDNDCDGDIDLADQNCLDPCVDNDSDGYGSPGDPSCSSGSGTDCNDNDATMYPGAPKLCDGKDNNCDGRLDFTSDVDGDSDGFPQCGGDCNDGNPNVNPGAQEGPFGDATCGDSVDNDCDLLTDAADPSCSDPCFDPDSDGYGFPGDSSCPNGAEDDCNNNNPLINPGAVDTNCNNVDENCSGSADDGYVAMPTGCGTGVCASAGQLECQNGIEVDTCTPGLPQQPNEVIGSTCNDTLDNDCDGAADAADGDCFDDCLDNDSDGYGSNGHPNCSNGTAIDCDDNDATINPGASDTNCNDVDENCSGTADDGYVVTSTNCGLGECAAVGQLECQSGSEVDTCVAGTPGIEGPVDDPNCSDGLDNDCDGAIDLADQNCLDPCVDTDSDGYGSPGDPSCPNGAATDCDDTDNSVYPGAPKLCDGKDNDCDGRTDIPNDVDGDSDGFPICGGDCNDNNPNINPDAQEGPSGDPTCSDGTDNDCDGGIDGADAVGLPNCSPPTCVTRLNPKNGPHLFDLLDPADDSIIKSSCAWCHLDDAGTVDERQKCERCHADPAWGGPDDGTIKEMYPLDPPYGFGTALNVRMHSSTVVGPQYGNWDMICVTCHNPHLQEQDARFGTSYGKYIKEFICFDNPVTGLSVEELIEFSSPTGPGSFADGPPFNENICEMCHVQTNHHRRTGDAPGDLDSNTNYIGHSDSENCTECHLHDDGFRPVARAPHNTELFNDNCDLCHLDIGGTIDFVATVPDSKCLNCHGERRTHTSASNPLASGDYTFNIMCVDCHNPMTSVGNNRKLLRPSIAMSVIPGSVVSNTTRRGTDSLADGAPRNENICETCHSGTLHNRGDGTGTGVHIDTNDYDGFYCMICHDHNNYFMTPGKTCIEENEPGIICDQ